MRKILYLVLAICGFLSQSIPALAQAPSLLGSATSVRRMDREANRHNFTRLEDGKDVRRFVRLGLLVPIYGNRNYRLSSVSFPYVRPEVRTFIERFTAQSRQVCRGILTVTSSTRPTRRQPRNASPRSVHPTGMAVDFRIPRDPECRTWVENTLKILEGERVLEATRERRPPHYHVAVFPSAYAKYLSAKNAPPKKSKVAAKKPTRPRRK